MAKLSRRKLLVTGAAAGSLPLLHQLVPHEGLHHAIEGAEAADPAATPRRRARASWRRRGRSDLPAGPDAVDHAANGFDPTEMLRDFDWGVTRRLASGRVLREWTLVAERQGDRGRARGPLSRPGPTTAASRARRSAAARASCSGSAFVNGSEHPHTIHFHGIHPAEMDGVPGHRRRADRDRRRAPPTSSSAEPFGLHLYHCHVGPLAEHIARGPLRRLHRRSRRRGGPRRTSW